ncbi:MAG: DoxX family protein [Nitrococcus sp.]|nr:DoxX family protein [Nitrococcus sp.]
MNTNLSTATSTPGPAVFQWLAPLAYPLVRVTAGLLLMPHGAQKLFGWFGGHGLTGTGQYFETALGMYPGVAFALLAGLIEFFGGLALVLGLLTRPAALTVAAFMAVIVPTHFPNGFFWSSGGFEYPLMWGLVALAIFFHGGDRYSLDAKLGLRI